MNSARLLRSVFGRIRILHGLAAGMSYALAAFCLSASAADPDLSNLDRDAVVKSPAATPNHRMRGFLVQPAASARATASRGYDPTRGVVTIEEIDGSVKELPYVVLPILFKVNSDEFLDAQSEDNLRKLAVKLQEPHLISARFVVEGHTSTEGSPEHNLTLSKQRADRILRLLVDQFKVEKSRLSAKGYGLTAPEVRPEIAEHDRQRNRRVLIVKESNGQ